MAFREYLAGLHAIEETLSSGLPAGELFYSRTSTRIETLIRLAREKEVTVTRVPRETLDRMMKGREEHRGVVLALSGRQSRERSGKSDLSEGRTPGPDAAAVYRELGEKDQALVLILDGITDPHNLGAILRSADQFDVDLVITPNRGSAQETAVVRNSSAGASAWVPVLNVPNLTRVLEELKEMGFWIYGAHMEGIRADRAKLTGKTVLVMGSEGKGIRRLVAETCDGLVSIPTGGHIDSLNVSVAAGILLYEIRRQGWGN